jgi:DNA-binding transcriptional LysR family regulator
LLPRLIREYRALDPAVAFSLRNVLTADQVRMLEEGSLDLGFLWMPFVSGTPSLEVALIQQEPWILAVPASHALAKKSAVRLCETADESYVLYERRHSPAFYDFVLGTLNRAGVIPPLFEFAGEMTTLISLIASGVGISVVAESAVKTSTAAMVGRKILDKIPTCQIGLDWRKKQIPTIVEQFRKFVLTDACTS